ncbi:flagellar biosynthesis protein FlhB [Candidatus Magnetobacterium bavaricum]|uniref:Flagellar biosynthetic protein FlhB n=1 Tax=Candidatus Magnetobacterium bavaricum TaxID=29290 RepID=A0A0F3GYY9_9BACT|nr:flagellar biosynthesis protein FlhB [Candidatus Magnetobacterium bavaricum]
MPEQDERSEQATPRRRQRAREKGQTAKSREVTALAGMAGVILVVHFGGNYVFTNMSEMTTRFLTLQYGMDPFTATKIALVNVITLLIPFFIAIMTLALASDVAQVGFFVKPLELNLSKLNPVSGLQRLFSFNGLIDFLKSLLKFVVGGIIFYQVIKHDIYDLPNISRMELLQIASIAVDFLKEALLYGFLYLFIVAAVSYVFEKWRFEKSIKMSKEEIKEEFKETEGDPKIKSRIRSIQREQARKRMMAEVPKATVIITNPTHLAVALRYKEREMAAPKLIAKGSGYIAERIREIAKENGIPVVEDKPLARTLFKLEINTFIPPELYKAVAKILAYIFRLKGGTAA